MHRQIRAARRLIDWSLIDLSLASGVRHQTLHRAEKNVTEPRRSTLLAIRTAFEKNGVEFFMTEDGDHKVRLKYKAAPCQSTNDGRMEFYKLNFTIIGPHGKPLSVKYQEFLCRPHELSERVNTIVSRLARRATAGSTVHFSLL